MLDMPKSNPMTWECKEQGPTMPMPSRHAEYPRSGTPQRRHKVLRSRTSNHCKSVSINWYSTTQNVITDLKHIQTYQNLCKARNRIGEFSQLVFSSLLKDIAEPTLHVHSDTPRGATCLLPSRTWTR